MERQENDFIPIISTTHAPYSTPLKGLLNRIGDWAMPLKVGFYVGLTFAAIGLMLEFLFGPSL